MTNLNQIKTRHQKDRWKDAGFVVLAGLFIAVSIGAWTRMAAGKPIKHTWALTVIESPVEIVR